MCRNESDLCLRGGDLIVVNNKRAAHRWRCEHAQLRLIHGSRGALVVRNSQIFVDGIEGFEKCVTSWVFMGYELTFFLMKKVTRECYH